MIMFRQPYLLDNTREPRCFHCHSTVLIFLQIGFNYYNCLIFWKLVSYFSYWNMAKHQKKWAVWAFLKHPWILRKKNLFPVFPLVWSLNLFEWRRHIISRELDRLERLYGARFLLLLLGSSTMLSNVTWMVDSLCGNWVVWYDILYVSLSHFWGEEFGMVGMVWLVVGTKDGF